MSHNTAYHYLYSFKRYLYELTLRLFYALSGLVLTVLILQWYQSTVLLALLPDDSTILFTYNSADELSFYKLSLILALLLHLPVGCTQLLLFVRPGLYRYQSESVVRFLRLLLIAYLIVVPFGVLVCAPLLWEIEIDDLRFFEGLPILTEITLRDYTGMIVDLGLLSLLFVPLFAVALSKVVKGVGAHHLSLDRYRRSFYAIALLAALLFERGFLLVGVVLGYEICCFHGKFVQQLPLPPAKGRRVQLPQ